MGMTKKSKMCCPRCGFNLRKLKKNPYPSSRNGARYWCFSCDIRYLIKIRYGKEGTIYTFRIIKEEEENEKRIL